MLLWSQGSSRTWNGDGHRAWRARLGTSQRIPRDPVWAQEPFGALGMLLAQDKAPQREQGRRAGLV